MKQNYDPLGLKLFVVYLLFYCGFVGLAAFWPDAMERTPLLGLNVAILYGFALIIVAFVLALIYGCLGGNANKSKDEERQG